MNLIFFLPVIICISVSFGIGLYLFNRMFLKYDIAKNAQLEET